MNSDCPVCGQRVNFKKLFPIADYKGKDMYTILECSSCKVKKTEPIPNDLTLVNTDEPVIPKNHWLKSFLVRREIKRIVKLTRVEQFLDIGPGDGEFSESLSAGGYSVIAADTWPERPYYLKNKKEIPYVHFDYESIEADDPSVINGRTVVLRHVLEHIRDPQHFLKKLIYQGAKNFFIVVPNASSIERRIFKQYDSAWCIPCHLWHFDINSLRRLFEQLGLNLISFGYETTPTIAWSIRRYIMLNKRPKYINNIFPNSSISLIISMLLSIFFPNNVLWALVEVKK